MACHRRLARPRRRLPRPRLGGRHRVPVGRPDGVRRVRPRRPRASRRPATRRPSPRTCSSSPRTGSLDRQGGRRRGARPPEGATPTSPASTRSATRCRPPTGARCSSRSPWRRAARTGDDAVTYAAEQVPAMIAATATVAGGAPGPRRRAGRRRLAGGVARDADRPRLQAGRDAEPAAHPAHPDHRLRRAVRRRRAGAAGADRGGRRHRPVGASCPT